MVKVCDVKQHISQRIHKRKYPQSFQFRGETKGLPAGSTSILLFQLGVGGCTDQLIPIVLRCILHILAKIITNI